MPRQSIGLTSPPPAPRINAAQRRAPTQLDGRMNREERNAIRQGQAVAPQGARFQGNPQGQPQQRPPMPPPQTGGGSQAGQAAGQAFNNYMPQAPNPMQRPQFQTPPNFQPGQMPQMPWQGFNPWGQMQFQGQQSMPYGTSSDGNNGYNNGMQGGNWGNIQQGLGQFYKGRF